MNDVTQMLSQIELGDPAATEELLPLVYDELRRLAARKLSSCLRPRGRAASVNTTLSNA